MPLFWRGRKLPGGPASFGPAVAIDAVRLRSQSGDLIRASADGVLQNDAKRVAAPGSADLLLLRASGEEEGAGFGLLVADTAEPLPLRLAATSTEGPVIAVLVRPVSEPGCFVLRRPATPLHLCAPPAQADDTTDLDWNRWEPGGWERFEAEQPPVPIICSRVLDAAHSAGAILAERPVAEVVLAWFRNAPADAIELLGAAIVALLPRDVLATLAAEIVSNHTFAARLATTIPPGHLLRDALPALVEWSAGSRIPTRTLSVSAAADGITTIVTHEKPVIDPAIRLVIAARRATEPTRTLAIVASGRNEGPYYVDWIAHHLALGVEHFFLYSNNNDDGSDALLEQLALTGLVTFVRNEVGPDTSAQRKMFGHAFTTLPDILDFRWTAQIDIDEFIVLDPEEGGTLPPFLRRRELEGADAIALHWRMFTRDLPTVFADVPLTERLRSVEPGCNPHVKTIVRTSHVIGSTPHAPVWPVDIPYLTLAADGSFHHAPGQHFQLAEYREIPEHGPASINHYHLKSFEEFIWKSARNRGDRGASALHFDPARSFIAPFFFNLDKRDGVPCGRSNPEPARVAAARARLMACPGVADAHHAVVALFRAALRPLIEDAVRRADEIDPAYRERFVECAQAALAAA